MHFLVPATRNPCQNLAVEEILLTKSNEEFIILGINDQAIISGKHQCIHREIDTKFVWENSIPVIRRISGGGTVYHDPGNLNYTFILNSETGKQINFALYTKPVIEFLRSHWIDAVLQGSDIKVDGFKISGNAEHVYHNRVLHHGTVLFNASLESLRKCLRKDGSYYNTRAISSKPSSVKNLSEMTGKFGDIEDFRTAMLNYLMGLYKSPSLYEPDEKLRLESEKLTIDKYGSWDWNYAYGPEYSIDKEILQGSGQIRLSISVNHGIIEDCRIEDNEPINRKIKMLCGRRHMPEDITDYMKNIDLETLKIFDFF